MVTPPVDGLAKTKAGVGGPGLAPALERAYLDGPGGRLAYVDVGPVDGAQPAVVFVHGWGADAHDWDAAVARFSPERRVLAADLRGHGGSAPSPNGYRPQLLAADLAFLVRARVVAGPVVLVGHSLGAVVASVLAVEWSVPVAGLVVVDPAYGRPAGHRARVEPWVARLRDGDAEFGAELVAGSVDARRHARLREYLFRRARDTPRETIWRALADLHLSEGAISAEPAGGRYLEGRAGPVLALNRDRRRARWEAGVLASSRAPGAGPASRSLVWEDTGHFPHLEEPQRFHALLAQWLGLLAGAPARTFTFGADVVEPAGAVAPGRDA
ncbi:alpha/beta fold hydrolase [Embleya sp. AB8]|uniref:alpha/beta fold hydrolase n=1 Tax=Embleya sp. AB8 TaxID=3156304 RepID=UPI003C76FE55